jgi:hypothetical protein
MLGDKVPGLIDRTTVASYLRVPAGYLPDVITKHPELAKELGQRLTPALIGDGGIEIGPIPAGMPVNLLTNVNVLPDAMTVDERIKHDAQMLDLIVKIKRDLLRLPKNATGEEARKIFANLKEPLLALSKCPDFVVNRGHYFGTSFFKEEPGLSDDDKRALIEFLKTF